MEELLPVLGVAAAVFFVALLWAWHFRRSRDILRRWADENGYELVSVERRFVFRGPFWWRTAKGQEVFYVVVRDSAGHCRNAHVRVGGWFTGLLSDQVSCEWEDRS